MGLFREAMAAVLLTYRRLEGTQKPAQHVETWVFRTLPLDVWSSGVLQDKGAG